MRVTVSYKRLLLIVTVALVFGASVVLSVLSLVAPAAAPPGIVAAPALHARLARRLLFVIVDGLRYDVASDPARMPHFAAAMRAHTSGESWAGRVSMTTSGVLALGTGQRGRLEQVIRNLSAKPPPYNSWFANARRVGVKVAVAGDPAWSEMYGKDLAAVRLDPEGVAGDADFNAQTFAGARALIAGPYDAVIAHFVTPDHQGHSHGIRSKRYTKHIHGFDADLAQLLRELDASWTIVVTSDHGAADTGTHGADVPVQRRSPVYAYGPGISSTLRQHESIDQLDLSATLPVLLGVSPPAHGTGAVLATWLDLPAAAAADVACDNAGRVLSYASRVVEPSLAQRARDALASCAKGNAAQVREQAAVNAVRIADEGVTRATGLTSPATWRWLVWISVLAFSVVLAVFGRACDLRVLVAGVLVLVVTVFLVRNVERLPGSYPNLTRGALLTLGNAALLALALWPRRVLDYFRRFWPYTPALLPGVLVVGYPADIAPEAYITLLIVSLVLLASSSVSLGAAGFWRGFWTRVPWSGFVVWLGALLVLLPVLYSPNGTYSHLLHHEGARRAVASVVIGLGLYSLRSSLGVWLKQLGPLLLVALAPVWLRSVVGPWLGRSAWFCLAALFVFELGHRRNCARALWFGMCSCLWLSRDFESVPLVAILVLSWLIGGLVASTHEAEVPLAAELLLVASGFCLLFALRIGLQDGLEIGGLNFGAGVFHDPRVGARWVGLALVYEYALAAILVLLALSHALSVKRALALGKCLLATFLIRAFALTCTFSLAGSSYWTALRIISDLPATLCIAFGALLFLAWRTHEARRAPAPARTSFV